mgnify:CR=1 FL=1
MTAASIVAAAESTLLDVVERGLIEGDWPFLAKPVAPEALARKARELLDG